MAGILILGLNGCGKSSTLHRPTCLMIELDAILPPEELVRQIILRLKQ